MRTRNYIWTLTLSLMVIGLSGAVTPTWAQRLEPVPEELRNVGVEEHLDASLPLDATFTDTNGKTVRIGDYFDGEHPVVLVPIYYTCPMLCGLTVQALTATLKDMKWTAGDEFRILTLSFDPNETYKLAKAKRQNLLKEYGRPGADEGWDLLVGKQKQIRSVTDAVGFNYEWNSKRREYAHVAALIVCTPDGRVSQYMYGVQYEPRTMRLLLVDAAEGKIGSPLDQLLLYCLQYNAADGAYAPMARNIMRAGGTVTVIVLGIVLFPVWFRAMRRKRRAPAVALATHDGPTAQTPIDTEERK